MAQVSATQADQVGLSSDIIVSTASELQAAIATAPDGATIRLMEGNYGALNLTRFSKDLTLVADRDAPAVLDAMRLVEVTGLTLDGLVFDYRFAPDHPHFENPYAIQGSQDITIRNALFDGDDATGTGTGRDGYGTGNGLSIFNSRAITVEDSEITGFWKGIRMGNSDDIILRGNDFHDMRSDTITMGEMNNTLIADNHFHNFRGAPESGDHTDVIQLVTGAGNDPSSGITISGNIMNVAGGTGAQGIFLTNGSAEYHRDFVIENNVLINNYKNGIVAYKIDGLVIRNNTILHADPAEGVPGNSSVPVMSVDPAARNVVIADNVVPDLIGHADQPDWDVSGTVIVQNSSPILPNHYSTYFVNPIGDFALDIANLTVRPDSVIAQQAAGASALLYAETSATLTPRIMSEQMTDNRAVYVFDAGLTTGPTGPVDGSMADFLWRFDDGTTASGVQVTHQFATPGAHTATLTVTMADGTTATSRTVATVLDSTVMSFDAESGTFVHHGPDGLQTLTDAPLVDHAGIEGRFLGLGVSDTVVRLPSTLLQPVQQVGSMEIDMRLAMMPTGTGSGEIMRQHDAFLVRIRNGEITLSIHQQDGGWASVTSSGARLDSGMWRDVKLVQDSTEGRLEIWIDGILNAETDGVGAMKVNGRELLLGGPVSHAAFKSAIERLELRTDPDRYDFADPGPQDSNGIDLPAPEVMPLPGPDEEGLLERPDLDTLRAQIEAGTSSLSLREATSDTVTIGAGHGGSLVIGTEGGWERLRDFTGDDVLYGGAGPDQFVFDLRHMKHAQTDRVLDLDFSDGDVLRFLLPDRQIWLKSEADIHAAVDNGLMTAELNADGSALELRAVAFLDQTVEIDLHAGFVWSDVA